MAEDIGRLVLRIGLGGLLLFHGLHKLLTGLDPVKALLSAHGFSGALAYIAYGGEILGPILILTGVFTRVGAFLVVSEVAALIALGGAERIVSLSPDGAYGLEIESFYIFSALALLFLGGGRLALTRGPLS